MVKKWIRNTIIAAVAVAVAGGGTLTYTLLAKAKSNETTTTFRTTTVKKGSISITVSGSGTVSSGAQYTLTAANSGTIDSVPVKEGDTVTKGEVIAHINDTTSAQQVQSKQNALDSANAALAQTESSTSSLYIKSPIAGRVKNVIVSSGDDLGTMKVLGSLCEISTDGKMKVAVSSSGASLGETVNISYNGTVIPGVVSSSSSSQSAQSGNSTGNSQGGSTAVVINRDDLPVGASVSVYKQNGTLIGTGTLAVNNPVAISGPGTGKVTNVYVSENTYVSKNTNLFKLDGSTINSEIESRRQQVQSAENDLASAQSSAAKATITSPVNGVVSELSVKAGDTASNGTSVATVVDPTQMQVTVSVDELDITKVKVGQKANISVDAITGKTFTGTVTQIDSIGTASNGVTTYNVTVAIENPTGIMVGMNATAEIVIQSKDNVLVIPTNAVQNKRGTGGEVLMASKLVDSNGKSVTLHNANMANLLNQYGKQVKLGITGVDSVEVVSGLSEGDVIAIPRTISKALVSSLASASTQNAYSGFGGMGGFSGMGGYSNRSNRTGTTTGGNGSINSNSAGSTNGNSTGNSAGGSATVTGSGNYSGNYSGKS